MRACLGEEQIMRSEAFIMEPRDGRPIHVVGDDVIIKISSRDTGGAFAVFENRTLPLHGPPLHVHHDQDEAWRILEGHYVFEVDGQEIYAGPGATVFAPRGSRHTFQNIGTTPGRVVTTVVPGGLDLFFEELEEAAPRGRALDPAAIAPLFVKYRMELLGPPIADRNVATASGAGAD
jgi:mannose-6-phosphate isomerase-like protein (cupin superfamily)